MMSTRNVEQLAGALMVTGFVAFMSHIATGVALGPGRTTVLAAWAYGILITLAAVALYPAFRRFEETLALFGAVGLAAHGLLFMLTGAVLLAGARFPQEFAIFSDGDTAASALESTAFTVQRSGLVFMSVSFVAIGVLISRSAAVARWIGWLGVAAGIAILLYALSELLEIRTAGFARTFLEIALLGGFGFVVVLGVRLVAREMLEVPAPS